MLNIWLLHEENVKLGKHGDEDTAIDGADRPHICSGKPQHSLSVYALWESLSLIVVFNQVRINLC